MKNIKKSDLEAVELMDNSVKMNIEEILEDLETLSDNSCCDLDIDSMWISLKEFNELKEKWYNRRDNNEVDR